MLEKLVGKGLFVFSDPAGAKAVLALVCELKNAPNSPLSDFLIISDRKYDFYEDFGFEVQAYVPKSEKKVLNDFKPDFIFTGTSYTSKIELRFIRQAQEKNIFSCAFIDHWTNFLNRFIWNRQRDSEAKDNLFFPNKICVLDEKAHKMAVLEGLPEEKLVILENPYYDFLRNWQPKLDKKLFIESLTLDNLDDYILFVPEPLSQAGGKEKFGFDEFDVLFHLVEVLYQKKLVGLSANLIIKLHPNQDKVVFGKKLQKYFAKMLENEEITEKNLLFKNVYMSNAGTMVNDLMFYADLVVGIFSNALIEGKLIGANVVRILPKTHKINLLKDYTDIKVVEKLEL